MENTTTFLTRILEKVARRYQLKGKLRGTMKIGQDFSHEEMSVLNNFFGLTPLKLNARQEVRLLFDKLPKNEEELWLEKIGDHLGYSLKKLVQKDTSVLAETLRSRLSLAFPQLEPLHFFLDHDCSSLDRMIFHKTEEAVTSMCFQAAEIVDFLVNAGEPITIAELGARFCMDSKALRTGDLRTLVLQWLQLCSFDSELLESEDDLWSRHNVLCDRLTVNAVLYGPIIYEKMGKTFDWIYELYQQGEAATLGWSNILDINRMYFKNTESESPKLLSCENEAPFSHLLRHNHNQALLFTGGFPNSVVQKLYQLLAPHASVCYHWGDSDPAGLRIASIMHSISPIKLFRCDISSLTHHKNFLLPLSQKQKDAAFHIINGQPDFPFVEELLFTLEHGWLEQENYQNKHIS